jgi:hypothetical protein
MSDAGSGNVTILGEIAIVLPCPEAAKAKDPKQKKGFAAQAMKEVAKSMKTFRREAFGADRESN